MSGHTPGPWEWEYEEGDGAHVIRMGSAIANPGHHQVQHSLTYEHGLFHDEDRPQALAQFHEAEANARLIAAAPELYEALRRVYDWSQPCTFCGKTGHHVNAPHAESCLTAMGREARWLLSRIDAAPQTVGDSAESAVADHPQGDSRPKEQP